MTKTPGEIEYEAANNAFSAENDAFTEARNAAFSALEAARHSRMQPFVDRLHNARQVLADEHEINEADVSKKWDVRYRYQNAIIKFPFLLAVLIDTKDRLTHNMMTSDHEMLRMIEAVINRAESA